MTAFIIRNLDTGAIEPNHEKRQGIWATRATALARIKSHWHAPWNYNEPNLPGETWGQRWDRREKAHADFRAANPFDQWWPQHYKIIELKEVQ